MYEIVEGRGLKLKCSKSLITSLGDVSYLAVRQDCHAFEIGCTINIDSLYRGAAAGLIIYQNNRSNIRFEASNGIGYVIVTRNGEETKYETCALGGSVATLIMRVLGLKAFCFLMSKQGPIAIAGNIDISALSTEVSGGFVGNTCGIYAHDYDDARSNDMYAGFMNFYYRRILTQQEKELLEEEAEDE